MGTGPYREFARYYDRFYRFKRYDREVRLLHALAKRELRRPGRSLLDVGCGTGHHLAEFRRWYEVAGVDASDAMLREARRRLGPSARLVRGDMRSFDLDRSFDVVTCLFSAYGYLATARDRARAAATFFRHTAPGGVALVEGWLLPEAWDPTKALSLQTVDAPSLKLVRITRSERRSNVSIMRMEYLAAETGQPLRRFREEHRMPLVPAREHLATFRKAGFAARVDRTGAFRPRGLYILRRPAAPEASRR